MPHAGAATHLFQYADTKTSNNTSLAFGAFKQTTLDITPKQTARKALAKAVM